MPKAPPTDGRLKAKRRKHVGRLTTAQKGYSERWNVVSRNYRKANPLCVMCGRLAEHVDHVVSIRSGGGQYDEDNLQSLCIACHNTKTRRDIHG